MLRSELVIMLHELRAKDKSIRAIASRNGPFEEYCEKVLKGWWDPGEEAASQRQF